MWKTVLWTIGALAGLAALAAALVIGGGFYDVAATKQHLQATYSLLQIAMNRSVSMRARDIEPPPGFDSAVAVRRGAACYRDHCVQCHGGPGVARDALGMAMQPVPAPLIDAPREWQPRELYWITRHGIKMSGMPAWQYRLADADLWAVTAFITQLPRWTPEQYAQAIDHAGARCDASHGGAAPGAAPDAERGRTALYQYACQACHSIPGVVGSERAVGPPLEGFATRQLIAGKLANTEDNLVRWIREPQRIDPRSAMPSLGVSEGDARDMAAYLGTLR